MKVAICTSDGSMVNQHFGKTGSFHIYKIDDGQKQLIEQRDVEPYSTVKNQLMKETEHSFDLAKFEQVYSTIQDCKKVYTISIGEKPKQKLLEKGIEVQICSCAIDSIPTCNGKCN